MMCGKSAQSQALLGMVAAVMLQIAVALSTGIDGAANHLLDADRDSSNPLQAELKQQTHLVCQGSLIDALQLLQFGFDAMRNCADLIHLFLRQMNRSNSKSRYC